MRMNALSFDVILKLSAFFVVRVFGDGVNSVQFTKFASLKCDDVAVCATSSPTRSVPVQSPIQCSVEGQSKRYLPQTFVGVNYREQNKVCEMFSANPTSFTYNVQGCQYMQKPSITTAVLCSDVNSCITNNGGCDPNAKCTSWREVVTCTCNVGYTGNGNTCTDVNECLTNNGGCSTNAQCTNTVGSFTCACLDNYFGNGFTCTQVAMNMVSNTISGTQTVSCDDGFQLLSCGTENSQTTTEDYFRYAIANNPTSCKCSDKNGVKCFAWCTNAVSGFEIMTSPVTTGYFSVTCSAGKKVLGCNIQGAYPQGVGEAYREHYPTAGGAGCTCYDHFGAWCVASCAANIRNYEVVSATGTGTFYVSCPAGKVVLGCGMGPSSPTKDLFKTVRITSISDNSCMCYHAYGAPCFATCGQFN